MTANPPLSPPQTANTRFSLLSAVRIRQSKTRHTAHFSRCVGGADFAVVIEGLQEKQQADSERLGFQITAGIYYFIVSEMNLMPIENPWINASRSLRQSIFNLFFSISFFVPSVNCKGFVVPNNKIIHHIILTVLWNWYFKRCNVYTQEFV